MKRGQGAFEYILMLAGVMLGVLVIVLLLRGQVASAGRTVSSSSSAAGKVSALPCMNSSGCFLLNDFEDASVGEWVVGCGAVGTSVSVSSNVPNIWVPNTLSLKISAGSTPGCAYAPVGVPFLSANPVSRFFASGNFGAQVYGFGGDCGAGESLTGLSVHDVSGWQEVVLPNTTSVKNCVQYILIVAPAAPSSTVSVDHVSFFP